MNQDTFGDYLDVASSRRLQRLEAKCIDFLLTNFEKVRVWAAATGMTYKEVVGTDVRSCTQVWSWTFLAQFQRHQCSSKLLFILCVANISKASYRRSGSFHLVLDPRCLWSAILEYNLAMALFPEPSSPIRARNRGG